VRLGDEPGIHFLAEWLSNRLAVKLGPEAFGLPYRHGNITYGYDWRNGLIRGRVGPCGNELVYHADFRNPFSFHPCEEGSLEEWLMERYTAFNSAGGRKRFFRVWHPPWLKCDVEATIERDSLLTRIWPWFSRTNLAGANFSHGFADVWMGRPHSLIP